MEEEDNIIVKWAQEDVETSYSLLNKYEFNCKAILYKVIGLFLPKKGNDSYNSELLPYYVLRLTR